MMKAKQPMPLGHPPSESILEFEVSPEGTLRVARFAEATIRADFYDDVVERWDASPADLADAIQECQPLAWEVHSMYSDRRDQLRAELETARSRARPDEKEIAALESRLNAMPGEPEEGARNWLLRHVDEAYFNASMVERIRSWFAEPPRWGWEDDYLPEMATAQGAALAYFRDLDPASSELLGVDAIEGEHPGSSYYAAVLRGDIEKANAVARAAGLPVRFVRQKA
ncbi:hypothetical protein [Variovorax guangxiensis]|uniref:hypothetical protein n=1 Tax=Variovorax guangxiensis TaxID=1775474 RepID=UPI0028651E50|nr:hypothetical protein [Variovorax guangxiensis]MDR6859813.1 hypothetical protein [Variovorax guangxiensis]